MKQNEAHKPCNNHTIQDMKHRQNSFLDFKLKPELQILLSSVKLICFLDANHSRVGSRQSVALQQLRPLK